MWAMLALAIVVSVLVLYAPGYLVARSVAVSRFAAVAVAPVLTVFTAAVAGVALCSLGVSCSGPALFALTVAAGAVLLLIVCAVRRLGASGDRPRRELLSAGDSRTIVKQAALYLAVAFIMVFVVYVMSIDGPLSFSRNDDTTVHLSVARGFLETGTYSTLHVSSYLAQGGEAGFYPAAWHVVVAIVASFLGDSVTLATNAVIITFVLFVFPLTMLLFFTRFFGENTRAVWAGALAPTAFSAFPWGFLVFGQLLPNMISFMFVPACMVFLHEAVAVNRVVDRAKAIALAFVALVAIALAQPNGTFTFGVWAVLFGVWFAFYGTRGAKACVTGRRVALAVAVFGLACLTWAFMYNVSFMQSVLAVNWGATLSVPEAVFAGLGFMFTVREGVQPLVSALVLIGVIYAFRNPRYMWMVVAYAFALLAYVIGVSTEGVLKHVISGFWYTDYYRTGAMTALFAMPLLAMGTASIAAFMQRRIALFVGKKAKSFEVAAFRSCNCRDEQAQELDMVGGLEDGRLSRRAGIAAAAAITLVFFAVQFCPLHVSLGKNDIYSGPVGIMHEISTRYSWERGLTGEEDAFVKQAMELIPEGSLIINVPSDGSCWSYGVEGANMYFRRSADSGLGGDEASEVIRTRLCDIAESEEVARAVEDAGARYVLMLDDKSGEDRTVLSLRYSEDKWRGIESITEETPGFKLVLSEGDMRLYQIEG